MLSAAIHAPVARVYQFRDEDRPLLSRLVTAASVAICLFASTGRADTNSSETAHQPVSQAVLQELKPYAAKIGESRRLIIHDAPGPAAPLAFTGADGAAVTLSDFKGKIVLVNFWATFCGPCLEEMPSLDALQKELGGDQFQVVAINLDPTGVKRPLAWLEKNKIGVLAFYHDRSWESARAVGSQGLPTTLLIDRAGREVGRLEGAAHWDSEDAKKAVRLLIEGAPAGG